LTNNLILIVLAHENEASAESQSIRIDLNKLTMVNFMTKPGNIPKDWKQFRLADGTMRWLPDWADKPLKFAFSPDEALRHCARNRLPKPVKSKHKARR
jgi:hypothetical protein